MTKAPKRTDITTISRKDAAHIIELANKLIAQQDAGSFPGVNATMHALRAALAGANVTPPRKCNGEAHSNPNIDHCGVCMPDWGWIAKPIKVR